MAKINILDSSIYNKISAGEVVERPASVVKELIENSIDANAKNIIVEIENGGIDCISISDDGVGIENDDIERAFLPHATSKIKIADDLSKIQTMGFRGEALASIASVAHVEMQSKTDSDELGCKIFLQGGEILSKEFISVQRGTIIKVKNIFYNVPARKKFLKKPKLEENAITDIVGRLILTHYDISIRYIVDGKVIFDSNGIELEDALYTVYGKQILDNVIKIEYNKHDIEITGYLGKPIYARPNRTYQTLSINHRFVQNSNISFAVLKGYENYLMKGKFPFFVLNINVPLNSVDVNVHPQKMEVRIENDGQVFGAIYKAVQDVLIKNRELATFTDFGMQFKNVFANSDNQNANELDIQKADNENRSDELNSDNKKATTNSGNEIKSSQNEFLDKFKNIQVDAIKYLDVLGGVSGSNLTFSSNLEPTREIETIQEQKTEKEVEQNTFLDASYNILGTLFNTYILLEQGNNLIIIDQHASHERILYEQLKKKIENKTFDSHNLLVPYIFNVTPQENEIIENLLPALFDIGFEIELFGNLSYKISAVPFDDYVSFNAKEFIDDLLKTNYKTNDLKNNLNDFLATRACKSAVKGGDKLSKDEISYLVNEIIETNTPMFCPHGRPIAIKFEKKDVEKWFKRII